ncbi:hypothetical protein GGF42_000106 [Coemansia sp. RSA 2424]|nr:hypothetical protein GGF42_000106 [Coemansia sp. RSA 2424]
MMQEETIRSLSSLSLSGGGGAGNRSSVVDRVKWIEQTHGGGPSTQGVPGAQPRARLRLPKHFISAQAEAATATPDASLSPKTPPAGLLSPRDGSNSGGGGGGAGWGAARLPPAMTQQLSSSSKIPTLARRAEQMPSPAISEASTVAGADEVFSDAPAAAKAASAANAASAVVPAVVEAVVEVLPDVAPPVEAVAPSPALVEAPHTTIEAVDIEPQEPESVDLTPAAVSVEPVSVVELAEPVSEANPVEPVPVADLIELEAAEPPLLSPMERSVSQAESTHARMPSEAPSAASNCSSNLTDPDDPVHVTSTMGGAGQYNNNNARAGANDTPRAAAAEPTTAAAVSHYATLPRSTKFNGSKVQGLGGTRNRPQQAPRRYDRSQPTHQRPESSASMQSRNSEDSCRSGSVFSRPKVEAPRLQAKEQSLARSFSTKPAMFSKSTPPHAAASDGDQEEASSLLARLNDLSATRPNAQDMVSNRSSPKFVKRSQYYGPSSQDDVVSSGSNGSGPRNRAQRRFR